MWAAWAFAVAARAGEPAEPTPEVSGAAGAPAEAPSDGEPAPGTPPAPEGERVEEPAQPEPEWVDLSVPVDFGSAVPDVDPTATAGPALRGRFSLRPWLGFIGLPGDEGGWGGIAGGVVGHQWWSLRPTLVRPAGETRARLVAPFGELRGWQAELDVAAGVWVGPIGLLAGPTLRAERMLWRGGAELAPALTLGPQLRLAAAAGPLTPWVAVAPSWILAGQRTGLRGPWDEARVEAGLVIDVRPVAFRLSGGATWSSVGLVWSGALGLQLRLF